MTADDDEVYFPRGGTSSNAPTKKRHYVFEKKNKYKEPKKKLGKRERTKLKREKFDKKEDSGEESEEESFLDEIKKSGKHTEGDEQHKITPLNYLSLTEGMVLLCSVDTVLKQGIKLSLPERLLATVPLRGISTPFNLEIDKIPNSPTRWKYINIKDITKVGDVIACKIKSVKKRRNNFEVVGSTDPVQVNSDLSSNDVRVGSVVFAVVKSVEDHGYMMFSGINGLNMFLPFSKCSQDEDSKQPRFCVGKFLWCKVIRADSSDSINNVQVTIEDSALEKPSNTEHCSSKTIHPGMPFTLTIVKHVSSSLLVKVKGTEIRGYVASSQLPTIESKAVDFKVGSEVQGTVLFKYPISPVIAFSLRVKVNLKTEKTIETGEVFESAEIVSHSKRGIGVKFNHEGQHCYGIISGRKMEGDMNGKNMEELFPIGNHLNMVIIGHHSIDQLYSCSTEDELLSGKTLTTKLLKQMIGNLADVKIVKLTDKGALVTVSNKLAFVPASQITDAVAVNPTKKLQMNKIYKGRILKVDEEKNSILVTLRPTLVNSEPLTDFDKVKKGDFYYGSICSIQTGHVMVSFFNGLRGKILQQNLIQECSKYTIGELVKCYVVKKEPRQRFPVLSLVRHLDQMEVSIGMSYNLIVKASSSAGLTALTKQRETVINTTIPNVLLSDHSTFWERKRDAYIPGSTISAHLFSFNNQNEPVFTLRNSVGEFFREGGKRLLTNGLKALRRKSIIPTLVAEKTSDGFYVSVPVPKYNRKALVYKKEMNQYSDVSLGDIVWLAVYDINIANDTIHLKYPSFEQNRSQLKAWAVCNLKSYLKDASPLQTYKIGQKVSAVATGKKNKCRLEQGRKGLVVNSLKVDVNNFSKGQPLDLTVIFEDLSSGVVYLLESIVVDEPSNIKHGSIKKYSPVFVEEHFFIGRAANGSLCFCPRFLHPTSTEPDVTEEQITQDLFLTIEMCGDYEGLNLGYLLIDQPTTSVDQPVQEEEEEAKTPQIHVKPKKRKRSYNSLANTQKPKTTVVHLNNSVSSTIGQKSHKKAKRKTFPLSSSESTSPKKSKLSSLQSS